MALGSVTIQSLTIVVPYEGPNDPKQYPCTFWKKLFAVDALWYTLPEPEVLVHDGRASR